ncbi:MAG: 50S ribosomal protein L21 [Deltaproteobacteria bacterium]|nr:50S ribosomal protein L21 [Deltaproteobacteria bacterium]
MYVIIRTGGKQYRVAQGDRLKVEKLEAGVGTRLEFVDVLMVSDGDEVRLGRPTIQGAAVAAEVIDQGRGRKVHIFKHKRRKGYRRHLGHRQPYTEVRITGIQVP